MAILTNPTRLEFRHFSMRLPGVVGIVLAMIVLSWAVAIASDPPDEEASDPTVYRWVFGDFRLDAAAARKQLDLLLRQKIAVIDHICKLTDAQKQKLELACRADNKELDDRIAEIAVKFAAVKDEPEK